MLPQSSHAAAPRGTMPTVQTKDGTHELDDVLAGEPNKPANRVAGEIAFTDHRNRIWTLTPTFEAALEIEDAIGISCEALRTHFTLSLTDASPLTRYYGPIIAAGIRASGEERVTVEAACKLAWQTGRKQLREPITEFLWALCDGGRGRAEDLGKDESSNGSGTPIDAEAAATKELIEEMSRRSADTSDSPLSS